MLSRQVDHYRTYIRITLIWSLIFLFIWVVNWKSSNEISPKTPQDYQQAQFAQIIPEKLIQQPEKISEVNILENLDKILDYDENDEVFNSINDEGVRQNVLTLRQLLKERFLVEANGMQVGEDLEAEILRLLHILKGSDYN